MSQQGPQDVNQFAAHGHVEICDITEALIRFVGNAPDRNVKNAGLSKKFGEWIGLARGGS
jgi:hypothetical protein